MTESQEDAPTRGHSETEPVGDLVLIRRMLEQSPEDRLLGLALAAAFFADARRV